MCCFLIWGEKNNVEKSSSQAFILKTLRCLQGLQEKSVLLFLVQVTSPPATKNTSRRVDLHLLNTVGGRQPPCLFWAPTLLRDAASASGAYVNTLNITTSSPQGNSAGRRRTLSTFQSGWRFVFVSWSRAALLTEQRCFYQTQPEPPVDTDGGSYSCSPDASPPAEGFPAALCSTHTHTDPRRSPSASVVVQKSRVFVVGLQQTIPPELISQSFTAFKCLF